MPKAATHVALLWAFIALSPAAQAEIYRCTGVDGKTLYSDMSCPPDSLRKSNITSDVGACGTAECEAAHQQQANEARERLRAEKAQLDGFAERRRRQALEAELELARAEELRWRQALDARLSVMAQEAAAEAGYPVYSGYPVYVFPKPCARRCLQPPLHRWPRPVLAQGGLKGRGLPFRDR
jgi:hypothetical protein